MNPTPKRPIGRPRLPAGKARVGLALSTKLSGEEWVGLDRVCELARCSRADAVRKALAHYQAALEGAERRRKRGG